MLSFVLRIGVVGRRTKFAQLDVTNFLLVPIRAGGILSGNWGGQIISHPAPNSKSYHFCVRFARRSCTVVLSRFRFPFTSGRIQRCPARNASCPLSPSCSAACS